MIKDFSTDNGSDNFMSIPNLATASTDKCELSLSSSQRHLMTQAISHVNTNYFTNNAEKIRYIHEIIPLEARRLVIKSFPLNEVGEGFVLIKNLPIVNHDLLLIAFSTLVGMPVHYLNEGDLIMNIKVDRESLENNPSYKNSKEMTLHTDLTYFESPPDVIGILCIYPGTFMPKSFYCKINDIISLLSQKDIEELMKEQFIFRFPEHVSQKAKHIDGVPRAILIQKSNQFIIRFRHELCYSLTPCGQKACDSLMKLMMNNAKNFTYESSSLVLLDNKHLTHGRNSFIPDFNKETSRRLIRVYINRFGAKSINLEGLNSYNLI